MSVNRLEERVRLLTPVHTPDGGGGHEIAWTETASLWAEVRPLSGAESPSDDGRLVTRTGYRVRIRAPRGADPVPRAGERFAWRGEVLAIEAVLLARGAFLDCLCARES